MTEPMKSDDKLVNKIIIYKPASDNIDKIIMPYSATEAFDLLEKALINLSTAYEACERVQERNAPRKAYKAAYNPSMN